MQSMKSIFKQVLIVVAGIFASLVIFLAISLSLLQPRKPKITDKTVLHIVLRGEVVEHVPDTLRKFFQGEEEKVIDLIALKDTIEYAQKDKNIQGIYLEVNALKVGWASLEEIRNALLAFQRTGKFIVAYGEHYTQKTYYLASLADDIVLHPESIFPLKGLSQTVFFYKALLDQLEIAPQVFRVGKYKSAVEPFTRQDMSQESKYQSSRVLGVIYDHFLDKIAAARGLKKTSIQAIADSLSAIMPRDAHQAKLVSQVGYFDDAESLIKTRLSLAKDAAINYVPFDKYASFVKPPESSKKQIAVLVVAGPIVDGVGAPGTIGSKELASSLRAISKDKSIKAVVLRINSPGGSALAADVLWRELILTKAQKPVVASMSDVAASGGYYLAAACDRILAHPTTITGSIGIFGLFFDVHALLSNKLGITTDAVKTGGSADLFENPGRAFNDHEKEIIQKVVDKGYDTFLERVAEGRKMKKEVVARVAGGRVWTGQNAKEQGLVDELGGLEAAVQAAAELAGIADEFTVSYWPKPRTLSEQVLIGWRSSVGNETTLRALQATFPALKHIQELINMTSIQARLPYRVEIE
jgi:protease IV